MAWLFHNNRLDLFLAQSNTEIKGSTKGISETGWFWGFHVRQERVVFAGMEAHRQLV